LRALKQNFPCNFQDFGFTHRFAPSGRKFEINDHSVEATNQADVTRFCDQNIDFGALQRIFLGRVLDILKILARKRIDTMAQNDCLSFSGKTVGLLNKVWRVQNVGMFFLAFARFLLRGLFVIAKFLGRPRGTVYNEQEQSIRDPLAI
jgi:hypothetical protein